MAYIDRNTSQSHLYSGFAATGVTVGLLFLLAIGLNFKFIPKPIVDFTTKNYRQDTPVVIPQDPIKRPTHPRPSTGTPTTTPNTQFTSPVDAGVSTTDARTDFPPLGSTNDQGKFDTKLPPLQLDLSSAAVQSDGLGAFGTADYPEDAIRNGDQGRTVAHFMIGASGRVTGCTTDGAPSRSLAQATCRIIMSRFHFTPEKNEFGNPVASARTQTVHWVLPAD